MLRRVFFILVLSTIVFSACEKQNDDRHEPEQSDTTEIEMKETVPIYADSDSNGYEKSLFVNTQQDATTFVALYSASDQPIHMKYLHFTANEDTVSLDGCNAAIGSWSASGGQFSVDRTYPATLDEFSGTIKLENSVLILLPDGGVELVLKKSDNLAWSSAPFSAIEAEVAGYPFGTYLSADLVRYLGEEVAREPYTMYETDQLAKIEYQSIIIDGFLGEDGSLSNVKGYKVMESEIETVRGIKVGDSLEYVIGKFPGSHSQNERVIHDAYGDIRMLYGEPEHMQDYGYILYENDVACTVIYASGDSRIVIELNERQEAISIEYTW